MFFGASLVMGYSAIKSFSSGFNNLKKITQNIIFQQLPSDYYLSNVIADEIAAINSEVLRGAIEEAQVSSFPGSRISATLYEKVNFRSDSNEILVKKDGQEITIENTIGPNEDVIRITYRRGITAGDILVELDMANDFLLADAEREFSLEDVISPSAELMLIPGSIAGAQQQSNIQKQLTELQKELYKILDNEFDAHYPNDIASIQSLTKIASDAGYKSGCSKEIVLKFIQNKFGINKKTADGIYSKIWPKSRPKYSYNEIKQFIEEKGGTLITTED